MFKLTICLILMCLGLFAEAQYTTIGNGVLYRPVNTGVTGDVNNVLITYAGWMVDVTDVWTDRLLAKSILNQTQYGIQHAYSVKGPRSTTYAGLEIENSKMITHLYNLVASKTKPRLILIIAHSSGSYVADEFFTQLYNRISNSPNDPVYSAIKKRIVYYNLDGATTPTRRDSTYVQTLFSSINFVWASKSTLRSMNSATMIAGPSYFSAGLGVKSVEVPCPKAGCLNSRCMHDAVITESPWNVNEYDTYRDYTLFSVNGPEVQSAYITSADLLKSINGL